MTRRLEKQREFTGDECVWVVRRLGRVVQHPADLGFPLDTYLRFIERCMDNASAGERAQTSAVVSLIGVPTRYGAPEKALLLLIRTLQTSSRPAVRRNAARVLRHAYRLDEEQLKTVQELAAIEEDPLVKRFLNEAVGDATRGRER